MSFKMKDGFLYADYLPPATTTTNTIEKYDEYINEVFWLYLCSVPSWVTDLKKKHEEEILFQLLTMANT